MEPGMKFFQFVVLPRLLLADMDFTSNAALAKFGFALGWQALNAKASR
jgi:hypothetical protein